MGAKVASEGTETVTLVTAAFTVARVAPRNTMLLLRLALKLDPERVTASPGLALIGLNDVMKGACAKVSQAQPNIITIRNERISL